MNHLRVITWCRWKLPDPYTKENFTIFTASVLKPSFEYPIASVSMSIVKGRYKVFLRLPSLKDLASVFVIPTEYQDRLRTAYQQALSEAGPIQSHQKALYKMQGLAPGSNVVRTDTGEIIAEAERIIKGAKSQPEE